MSNASRQLFHIFVSIMMLTFVSCAPLVTEYPPRLPIEPITIVIDNSIEHQTMEGFGATTRESVMFMGNTVEDMLTPALRREAIKTVYGQVGLTMGNLELRLEPANDDDDPFNYNWSGFEWVSSNAMHEFLVRPARTYGFNNYSLGLKVNTRWVLKWMTALRDIDYQRYLDEVAEYVTAGAMYWRKTFGLTPGYITLFNEPLSGNRELRGGSVKEIVDIIKSAGDRLRAEGFEKIKFIVPGEETVERSIHTIRGILADEKARSYVGALAYHAYPYHSAYSSIRRILQTSGAGRPVREQIQMREQLKTLAENYGLPVWMTEISEGPGNADFEFGVTENMRARAIHIHDELVYANASAFFGMNNMWDRKSHDIHFHNRNVGFFTDSSSIALVDQNVSGVFITGMGYAIGHYARWIKRGAIRIDATSSDLLLQVCAFRDDATEGLIVVMINNSDDPRDIIVHLKNIQINEPIVGEQSNEETRWGKIAPLKPPAHNRFKVSVEPRSIITVSAPISHRR